LAQFQQQWMIQKEAVDKLKEQLHVLNDRIEEAKRKRNLLIARQKRAEAQKTIQATMAGLSDTSAFDTFERMAERIEQIEAEAEAGREVTFHMEGDSLTQRFKTLESKKGPSDIALLELKAKMGLLPATAVAEAKALAQGTQEPTEHRSLADLESSLSKPK